VDEGVVLGQRPVLLVPDRSVAMVMAVAETMRWKIKIGEEAGLGIDGSQ
jgi:hypothetical protein